MTSKYFSRKYTLTLLVLALTGGAPIVYKNVGVSDTVTLTVLLIFASVGAAYGFINVKSAKAGLASTASDSGTITGGPGQVAVTTATTVNAPAA